MRNLIADFRHAARGLRAQPLFTLTAVLTLALGIGLTTTIFGVVNGIVLRPLAIPSADRMVTICEQHPTARADWCSISPPNVEDIAARARSLEAIGIARSWPYHMTTLDGAESVVGGLATPGTFAALGVRPVLGRLIERSDLIGRQSSVVMLTDGVWRTRFGGARDVVGRLMYLDGAPVRIIGVLPPGFLVPKFENVQLWRPLHVDPRDETNRDWRGFVAYARMRSGVSIDAARADVGRIADEMRREHFATIARWGLQVKSVQDLVIGDVKPVLLVFLGAVSLVLLVACANVANILLARGSARRGEMALRAALGASRWRIARALLAESFLLAAAGAALGVLAANWGTSAFKALAPAGVPRIDEVSVNGTVLLFALSLAIATTLLFGLVPAIRVARSDLANTLRQGGRALSGRGSRLGRALVVGELALALTLTFGASLLARSFASLTAWNPGFDREHLITFSLFAPSEHYPRPEAIVELWRRTERELGALPGVVGVGTTSAGPLFGGGDGADNVRYQADGASHRAPAEWFDMSPGYFATLGVPVVRGRSLDESDRRGMPDVAVVNETMARRFWPNENPIGKQLSMFDDRATVDIVGVVRDIPEVNPSTPTPARIFWSNRQSPRGFTYFLVRTSVAPASLVPAIRQRLQSIDRDLIPGNIQTMPELMTAHLKTPRFDLTLLLTFAVAALVLAAIGTYGLFAYHVARRTR
ncbi:MAG TPA: ABC transporter permease, partial [Gemmatimonadaceae bacterium]|nr:ABC transporter permease [Gemmatimonadaceae bacterium]